jgi:hypothetical protein
MLNNNGSNCVRNILKLFWVMFLIVQMKISHAEEYNLVLLPEPYCTQAGIEKKVSDKHTLGVIGRFNCNSERPTYGSKNDDVENKFSRVLVPLKHSFNGAFNQGAFIQGMIGVEDSEFKSNLGSNADVTYLNLSVHGGYQWYFRNGFNISVLGGVAHLQEINSSRQIAGSETLSVTDFINKNTETNTHVGAGVIVGWLF